MAKKKRLPRIPAPSTPAREAETPAGDPSSAVVDLSFIAPGLRQHAVPIADVEFLARNPREHTDEDLEATKASLREFGQVELLVVNQRTTPPTVLNGNGRLRGALALGWSHVAVNFVDLDEPRANALAVMLNRTGELAGWNKVNLAEILKDLNTGNDDVLDAIVAGLAEDQKLVDLEAVDAGTRNVAFEASAGGEGGDDFDPDPEKAPQRAAHGDLWIIDGKHRLYVGDSTSAEALATALGGDKASAVVTDPPYSIVGGGASIAGKGTEAAFDRQFYRAWLEKLFAAMAPNITSKAAIWFTVDWRGLVAVEEAAIGTSMRLAAVGVWNRGGLGMGYALRKTYENFALLVREKWKRTLTDEPDVWECQWTPANRNEGHAAEKPVELIERAMRLCGGDVVLDPFLGSGTSIIAAHRTGRRCCGVEIEPRYADVILKRCEAEGLAVEREAGTDE